MRQDGWGNIYYWTNFFWWKSLASEFLTTLLRDKKLIFKNLHTRNDTGWNNVPLVCLMASTCFWLWEKTIPFHLICTKPHWALYEHPSTSLDIAAHLALWKAVPDAELWTLTAALSLCVILCDVTAVSNGIIHLWSRAVGKHLHVLGRGFRWLLIYSFLFVQFKTFYFKGAGLSKLALDCVWSEDRHRQLHSVSYWQPCFLDGWHYSISFLPQDEWLTMSDNELWDKDDWNSHGLLSYEQDPTQGYKADQDLSTSLFRV